MTRGETDKLLREAITRSGAVAANPLARSEERAIAKICAVLALIVAEQEARLRALEGPE